MPRSNCGHGLLEPPPPEDQGLELNERVVALRSKAVIDQFSHDDRRFARRGASWLKSWAI